MEELVRKHALKNALDFGKANPKAVLGKVLAEQPELKARVKELLPLVQAIVEQVNSLSREEIEKAIAGYSFEVKREEKKEALPELRNVRGEVVMRFAPNPSGPLHLGHARAAVLNDEYVRRYGGRLILRLEDTDPTRVYPPAYEMIPQDLDWLGVAIHEVVVQSSRLEIYYEYARKLIEAGHAYVCRCPAEVIQKLKLAKRECEHRGKSVKENLADYARMFTEFKEGEAVVRLKTGVELADPAMRDFPIMRISTKPHPRVKARVYPLMNFSVTIDDHLLGVTHVLRGKDHIVNTRKQSYVYRFFDWEMPEFIHYGRLKIEGVALSTSRIRAGIEAGVYSGWDDASLGTLRALARRGFRSEAIRRAMLEVGVKQSDISFSWKNLFAYNRELIEPIANRYFFVASPVEVVIEGAPEFSREVRLHPSKPERGTRRLRLEPEQGKASVFIAQRDYETLREGSFVRLMEGFNIEIVEKGKDKAQARFHSFELAQAKRRRANLIHWVPAQENIAVKVVKPGGVESGVGEAALSQVKRDDVVQFERYGFARIDDVGEGVVAYYAHP
ncbi:glutamate--tRNA ligase [Candidatus Pyrohabitans sp.]